MASRTLSRLLTVSRLIVLSTVMATLIFALVAVRLERSRGIWRAQVLSSGYPGPLHSSLGIQQMYVPAWRPSEEGPGSLRIEPVTPIAGAMMLNDDAVVLASGAALLSVGMLVGALAQYTAVRLVERRSADRIFP